MTKDPKYTEETLQFSDYVLTGMRKSEIDEAGSITVDSDKAESINAATYDTKRRQGKKTYARFRGALRAGNQYSNFWFTHDFRGFWCVPVKGEN